MLEENQGVTSIYTREDIELGRQVWQSMGGMQLGSIWGHGAYVAPDWSADWLHREAAGVLDLWAQRERGVARYADLPEEQQATFRARLQNRAWIVDQTASRCFVAGSEHHRREELIGMALVWVTPASGKYTPTDRKSFLGPEAHSQCAFSQVTRCFRPVLETNKCASG